MDLRKRLILFGACASTIVALLYTVHTNSIRNNAFEQGMKKGQKIGYDRGYDAKFREEVTNSYNEGYATRLKEETTNGMLNSLIVVSNLDYAINQKKRKMEDERKKKDLEAKTLKL